MRKFKSNLHRFMAVPMLILFAVFFLYPLIQGIGISFMEYDGITASKFVGLDNFKKFFTDERAMNSMYNSLLFGIVSAALLNVFGLLYALILEKDTRLNRIARTVVYVPSVISGLIIGYVWKMILTADVGMVYRIMEMLHLDKYWHNYLGDMDKAIWVIILVNLLQAVGGPTVVYLAGLQSIDLEMTEAAQVDGASYFQRLWHIILPMLTPSIKINVITNLIGSLAVFDIIMALTGGGPGYSTESMSMFIYRNVYGGKTGYATAVAIILFAIILVPVAVSFTIINKKEREQS